MQRVKNIDYDEEELYSEEDYGAGEDDGYTDEDRDNFATLTPVVRAELGEAGLQASDREIEEALWHYFWDVGKSVSYLKNTRTPRLQQQKKGTGGNGKTKAKSKFDEAAERATKGRFKLFMFMLYRRSCEGMEVIQPATGRAGSPRLPPKRTCADCTAVQSMHRVEAPQADDGLTASLGRVYRRTCEVNSSLRTRLGPILDCSVAHRSSRSWLKNERRRLLQRKPLLRLLMAL
jgi:hypothetical protein